MPHKPFAHPSLLLIGLLSAALSTSAVAGGDAHHEQNDEPRHCHLAGVFIGAIPGQTTFTLSASPADVRGKNVMLIVDTTGNADPTAGGLVATATGQGNPRGFATREASGRYAGQLVRYMYDASRAVVGTELQVVSIEQRDCKTLAISIVARLFYFTFVNPGEAELPPPDVYIDGSGFPPTEAKRMLPYRLNQPAV